MNERSCDEVYIKLKEDLNQFPTRCGVYIMKNADGTVIYIGKAKNLRARVRSYFGKGDGRAQIEYLMRKVCVIDKVVTEDETQAFVLERDLINKYKPRYNIRLKDDKSYLSIRLDRNAPWPRIELTRKVEQDGALYFGPYTYGDKLRQLLEVLKRVVPLRSCTDTVFYNRQRPCLEYQIKRCAGPCCLAIEPALYASWVSQAIAILSGKTAETIAAMHTSMEEAAGALRFEEAAAIRDRIVVLEDYAARRPANPHRAESRDIFFLYREGRFGSACVLHVRYGRIADTKYYSFADLVVSDAEVLESVISQTYGDAMGYPSEIIVPMDIPNASLLAKSFKAQSGEKVEFVVPKAGSKLRLLRLAEVNAQQYFEGKVDAESRYTEVATKLATLCKLRQMPRRIECVDISNFQGSNIVGALVTFFDGQPDKSLYRTYKISFEGSPDDFRAVREVVTRRLRRAKEDGDFPDVLVIDGGPGQLASALAAREEVGIEVDIISLAKERTRSDVGSGQIEKKPERIYLPEEELPIFLAAGDPVTNLLARIRDEVHRFVIGFHRRTRAKKVFRSILDEISGLGPERRGRLLRHFGGVEAIGKAEVTEIAKVGRMPGALAEKVKRTLGGSE